MILIANDSHSKPLGTLYALGESMNLAKTEPTVSEIASKFGCTEERVRAQFRRNAAKIQKESDRIKAGGRNPNGFDTAYLDQRAKDYAVKGLCAS